MKRIIIIVLTMLAGIPAWSQTQPSQKRLENQIMIGAGLFGETGNRARNVFPGAVLRLSYIISAGSVEILMGWPWQIFSARHVTIWFQKGQRWLSALGLSSHIWFHLIRTTSMQTRMIQGTERRSSNDGISACSQALFSNAGSIGNGDLKPASASGT